MYLYADSAAGINTLPPELLLDVIVKCCQDDDGSTIRALGSVSQKLRRLCAPFRFHAVYIHGRDMLDRLFQAMVLVPHSQRRFRHLCISYPIDSTSTKVTSEMKAATQIHLILESGAPTLETLALYLPEPQRNPTPWVYHCAGGLLRSNMPHLRDLTIRINSFLLPDVSEDAPLPPSPSTNFPSLTHLHLIDVRAPTSLFKTQGRPRRHILSTVFPKMTHVHFSGLKKHDFALLATVDRTLARFLKRERFETYAIMPSEDLGDLGDSIERIIIQGLLEPVSSLHVELLGRLRTAQSIPKEQLKMRVELRDHVEYGVDEMRADWLERLAGREGSWRKGGTEPESS